MKLGSKFIFYIMASIVGLYVVEALLQYIYTYTAINQFMFDFKSAKTVVVKNHEINCSEKISNPIETNFRNRINMFIDSVENADTAFTGLSNIKDTQITPQEYGVSFIDNVTFIYDFKQTLMDAMKSGGSVTIGHIRDTSNYTGKTGFMSGSNVYKNNYYEVDFDSITTDITYEFKTMSELRKNIYGDVEGDIDTADLLKTSRYDKIIVYTVKYSVNYCIPLKSDFLISLTGLYGYTNTYEDITYYYVIR